VARGGFGAATAPNSIVATSSDAGVAAVMVALSEPTGAPQEEQKRTAGGRSAPHSAQVYTFFTANSVLVPAGSRSQKQTWAWRIVATKWQPYRNQF